MAIVHDYQYSVQVKSRFDLLGSDDLNSEDPDLLLKKIQSRKNESKAAPSAVKEDKTTSKAPAGSKKIVEPTHEVASHETDQATRGRNDDHKNRVDNVSGSEAQSAPRNESWEARGRGRGGFTRSRALHSSGQREFDRHSGSDKTGIKPVLKKDGHGTGNWGTMEDELDVAMAPEGSLDTHLVETIHEEPKVDEVIEPVEEEVKTITLKEYKEQIKSSKGKVQLSTKGTRKPNDGKDVFSDMVASNKPKPIQTQVIDVLEDTKPIYFQENHGKPMTHGRGRPSGPSSFGRGRGGARADNEHDTERTEVSSDRPSRGGRNSERGGGRGNFNSERGSGRGSFNSERGVGRGTFNAERGAVRGSFNSERGSGRGSFNSERGVGRGSFNSERGTGRGGFSYERGAGRGSFNPERGTGRGGFSSERGAGRGSFNPERGSGRGGFNSERGTGRGGFNPERGAGRGGFNSERGGGRGNEVAENEGGVGHSDRGRGAPRGSSRGAPGDRPSFRGNANAEGGERGGKGRVQRGGFRAGREGFDQRETEHKVHYAPKAPVMDSDLDFPVLK